MRNPLIYNGRRRIMQNEWNPGTLLELSGCFWKTATLHAAVKLDVFTALGDQELDAGEISARLGLERDAASRLLDALAAMNLLAKENEMYANTRAGARFLSKSSPDYMGFMVLHHHHLVDFWRRLDQSVRTGRPARAADDEEPFKDEFEREAFLMGMFNMASVAAPDLVRHVDLTGRARLLDMGGGPGSYAIHFCLRYPELEATVFDLEKTRPFAEKTIKRFGLAGRVRFEAGSYLKQELPGGYDVLWMSHVLHGEGYDACQGMIKKAWRALEPGGMIIVHDFILDGSRTQPLFPALFSLNMLVATEEGRAYTEGEISDLLEAAGFREIMRIPWSGPTESGLMTAVK
jgi:predicted O-methyltransferase YrrM